MTPLMIPSIEQSVAFYEAEARARREALRDQIFCAAFQGLLSGYFNQDHEVRCDETLAETAWRLTDVALKTRGGSQ